MKSNKSFKLLTCISSLLLILVIILSVLGAKTRTGYITDFKSSADKFSDEITEYTYSMRIRYYDKVFRNSDIYNVYPITNNLPDYIKSADFGKDGSPYGKIVSTKELNAGDKVDVGYVLRLKFALILLSVAFFILSIIFLFQNKIQYKYILYSLFIIVTLMLLYKLYPYISANLIYSSCINLIVWFYALIISYMIGSFTLNIIERVTKSEITDSIFLISIVGFVSLLGILQILSIFTRLWIFTFIVINIFTFIIFFIDFNRNKKRLLLVINKLSKLISNPIYIYIVLMLFISFLYNSSLIPNNYDSYLYHTQSMRWLEKFGTVYGLGNIHGRLAFGSSWIILETFFAMSFILKTPLHAIHNFIGFIFCLFCAENINFKNKKNYILSIFSLIILAISFFDSINFIHSNTSTDLIPNLYYMIVLILWIKAFSCKENRMLYFVLIVYLSAFTVTAKISMATIVLISLFVPIYILFSKNKNKNKNKVQILFTIAVLGLFISVPFLIRNVMHSGYLVYPYPNIDIFNVDWKVPIKQVIAEKASIISWARLPGPKNVSEYSISEWFPLWWKMSETSRSILFFKLKLTNLYILSIALAIASLFISIRRFKHISNPIRYFFKTYPIFFISIISIIFWFFTAPDYRFAFSFWIVLIGISLSMLLYPYIPKLANIISRMNIKTNLLIKPKLIFYTSLLLIISSISIVTFTSNKFQYTEYTHLEIREVKHKNIGNYYIPTSGDQSGYYYFPGTTGILNDKIYLRGKEIKDGFKYVK